MTGGASDGGTTPRRTRAVVAAELADVERYLREVPPHSGGGIGQLEARRAVLQRELAALREDGPDLPPASDRS